MDSNAWPSYRFTDQWIIYLFEIDMYLASWNDEWNWFNFPFSSSFITWSHVDFFWCFRMFAPKCAACGKGITPVEVWFWWFCWWYVAVNVLITWNFYTLKQKISVFSRFTCFLFSPWSFSIRFVTLVFRWFWKNYKADLSETLTN